MNDLRKQRIPVLEFPELQCLLEPFVSSFSRTIWPILGQYECIPLNLRLDISPSGKAHVLNCFMVANAKREFKEFEGTAGVTLIPDQNGALMIGIDGLQKGINGSIVCRLKKLDDANLSRNARTARVESLQQNEYLPGLPPYPTYVDVGYLLSDLGNDISAVHAVRYCDTEQILEIPRRDDQSVPMPQSLPGMDSPRFRILPRHEATKSKDGDDDDSGPDGEE